MVEDTADVDNLVELPTWVQKVRPSSSKSVPAKRTLSDRLREVAGDERDDLIDLASIERDIERLRSDETD